MVPGSLQKNRKETMATKNPSWRPELGDVSGDPHTNSTTGGVSKGKKDDGRTRRGNRSQRDTSGKDYEGLGTVLKTLK